MQRHFRRKVIRLLYTSLLEDDEDDSDDTLSSTALTDDDYEVEISNVNVEGSDEIVKDKILNTTENSEDTNPNSTDNTEITNPNLVEYEESIEPDGVDDAESTCSSSSESLDLATPETTSSVSSTQNERVKTMKNSVLKVDIDEIQSSLDAQISSPVVRTLCSNKESVQNAEKCRSTDEFPFLMGGSTVCEYIGNSYEEVVTKNSPNTGVLRVHVNNSLVDVHTK